ncbi:phosphatidylglycerophosphate synthase [Neisseria sp. HSC-16F19]|nr:CDP-alcohol phosphatidyltransferase family protein [Neisseria sp. HSC-16F19]MCP2040160.1 phosphatidylglycerophosphate synthase [Neisseria sp. HSC-16F19]
MSEPENRRPISARGHPLMVRFAAWLAARQTPTPNQISLLSAVFAAVGALALALSQSVASLLLCALCIQLRLLCNLLDGMVAVEGGKKTAVGEIFNEFPDRVADSFLLVALGYAAGWGWLGWLTALLAMGTAYIRVFGGSLGFAQSFAGPMAKQHRMALLTAACLLGAVEVYYRPSLYSLQAALWLMAAGTAWTCVRRTQGVARLMRARATE